MPKLILIAEYLSNKEYNEYVHKRGRRALIDLVVSFLI